MPSLKKFIVVAAVVLALPCARGQDDDDARGSLSRPMKTAIHFYEIGDDVSAMDRFMEILTKGDPTERSMANEYINLITHRMNNTGGAGGNPAASRTASPADEPASPASRRGPVSAVESVSPAPRRAAAAVEPVSVAPAPAAAPEPFSAPAAVEKPAAPAPVPRRSSGSGGEIVSDGAGNRRPARRDSIDDDEAAAVKPKTKASARAPRGDEMSSSNQALMRKEIKARLHEAQERSLAHLKAVEGVRVAMRENGDPEAIGIPSALLFQAGIAFQRDAGLILDPLTKLVFALGSTQVLILPEGTAMGDAKVLDMRRTMGISSTLYQAGVAPPRVRVNLLNTQVDIPKSLSDFKGVVVVFQYDQPMTLAVESAVGDELGPPISLGVYPPQIRPSRNQGAIVEFSVSDPPAGLVSWKFQLLQPSRDGAELTPLQEVVGGGPVFHQIFWNGRQNYFGNPLPPGRYECVLTALDAKNRQRTLHRWIQVLTDEGEGEALLSSGPEPASPEQSVRGRAKKAAGEVEAEAVNVEKVAAPAAPSDELPGGGSQPLVKGVKPAAAEAEISASPKPAAKAKRKSVRRAARAQKAAKAAAGDETPAAAKPAAETAPATPGHYQLAFNKNTHQMTDASEAALKKAAADLAADPLATIKIVGHCGDDETDGPALAADRAKTVAGVLVNRYQVLPKRTEFSSAAGGGPTAELTLVKSD